MTVWMAHSVYAPDAWYRTAGCNIVDVIIVAAAIEDVPALLRAHGLSERVAAGIAAHLSVATAAVPVDRPGVFFASPGGTLYAVGSVRGGKGQTGAPVSRRA